MRVLEVYLDAKVHWHKYKRIILQKAQKALSSLSRTSYSTWGFPVLTSCLVYTTILRSLLSYTVGIWFNSLRKSSNISSLVLCQNRCLRLNGGAFCHGSGPVAYLAQVTHLAGKSHLHCCLLALLLPDPLPIRTSPAPPASSLLLFSFYSFLVFRLVHQSKSQVSSQVRSRLLDQLGLSSVLPLPRHTFKATPFFLLESELFLLPLDLYFKFCTACFLSSIQTSSLKTLLDSTSSTISSYTSSLRKPLKESSTISPNWKFTWLSQITTNQASSKKELQKLFTKEWEN